jgi:hypothetical protein
VKSPPEAEEKAPPNTLNESRSAYSENTLVLQPIPSPIGITMTDGITMTNAVIECILSRSAAKYYDPAATLSDDQIRELVRIGALSPPKRYARRWGSSLPSWLRSATIQRSRINCLLSCWRAESGRPAGWAVSEGLKSAAIGKSMVALDGKRRPRVVLTANELVQRRFDDVDEQFADDEGDGDRSLIYWREARRRYFTRLGYFNLHDALVRALHGRTYDRTILGMCNLYYADLWIMPTIGPELSPVAVIAALESA